MKNLTLWLCLLFLLCTRLQAQVQQADSVLPEVVIKGLLYQPFTAGVKRQQLDSLTLQLQRGQSLANLLQERSTLYIREYGPGQLSTVSFRGTSSNHTAVLWNGLNINSPTLGQTDFSQIPVFALEDVQVQYGSSSALYGSDALGGSIQLQTRPNRWQPGFGRRIRQEVGSFGALFTGVADYWANRKWLADVRVYRRSAKNDFPYTNTLKKARPREHNTHSSFLQQGVVAQLGFKPTPDQEWWLQSWWSNNWREIQPLMGGQSATDEQEDEALRLNLQYKRVLPKGEWQMQGGWLFDEMLYNGRSFKTRQFIAKSSWDHDLSDKLLIQVGGQWNWRQAQNVNYLQDENRMDASARLRWQPLPGWVTSLNLRQIATDTLWGLLSPSIGTEVTLLRYLKIKSAAGKHYRLPTLHDRFWPIFGRPELKPEEGWHAEGSLFLEGVPVLNGKLQLGLTRYWLWINDWIIWRPTVAQGPDGAPVSGWGPKNLRSVYSRGWEGELQWQHRLVQMGATAAYTHSENRNALDEFDRTYRQQLPFVPLWKGSAWLRISKQGWLAEALGQYTGRRYTTGVEDIFSSLPPFYLLDVSAGKSMQWRSMNFGLLLQIRNLLDHQYQNYENRAMPGRSYNLTINYSFNKSEK